MANLSSYQISDFLLFSKEVLLQIFETYNKDIWPLQIFFIALSTCSIFLILFRTQNGRVLSVFIVLAWLFSGLLFHLKYFLPINWAAKYFASLFVLEAILIFVVGTVSSKLRFERATTAKQKIGITIFFIAAFVPVMQLLDLNFSQTQMFGWGIDMTALGTVGLIFAARWNWAHILLLIPPLLWCTISGLMYYGFR